MEGLGLGRHTTFNEDEHISSRDIGMMNIYGVLG